MGVSTNGQICFGVEFEEDYEFPWDAEEFGGDEDDWWLKVSGFKQSFKIYTEDGMDYLPEVTNEMKKAYFQEERDFKEAHDSAPVELVNTCSGDYPMYILAIPCTIFSASRGYPVAFELRDLEVNIGDVIALEKFCNEYNLEGLGKAKWFLSSYMG